MNKLIKIAKWYNSSDMKKSYKIAFIDIDWTILNHKDHSFDMPSIESIKKMQTQGVLIYFCTARTYISAENTGLFDLIKPDGMICTNGGLIFVEDKLIKAKTYPEDIVKVVLKTANRHHVVLEFATIKEKYFTNEINQYVLNYHSVYYEKMPEVRKNAIKDVTEILAFIPEKYDEKLTKELPQGIRYYRYDTYGVNLGYYQNQKGEAVTYLLDYLKIDKNEALAIGDSEDDISMFEAVGTAIAMGNAKTDLVKEKATIVTDTIDNHGVATIIANLILDN